MIVIDNIYLYSILGLNIGILVYKLYISYKEYILNKKLVNNIKFEIIRLYTSYIYNLKKFSNYYDSNISEYSDIDDSNNQIINYTNNDYTNNNYTNNNDYTNNNIFIKNCDDFREILLLYITYIFMICKSSHNNMIDNSKINYKNYDKYEKFIEIEINKIYFNFNINSFQFKINYLETLIEQHLTNNYYSHNLNITIYNLLMKYYNILQININSLINNITQKYSNINYITDLVSYINIVSFSIYLINNIPNIGIIFLLVLSYLIFYINYLSNFMMNSFNNNNIGINLDDILHNIYDELFIHNIFKIKNIYYYHNEL